MKKKLKLIAFFCLLGLTVAYCFYDGVLRLNNPKQSEYPIQGIDISHHQKEINWAILDKKQVQFVFIKATEGGSFKDEKFIQNWSEAKKQNIPRGGYHFFTFCKSGEEQAKNFMELVPKEKGDLPPVIDLEYGGNCKLSKSKEEVLKEILILEQRLQEYYEKKPILYVTHEFFEDFLMNELKDNPIWIRDIYAKPSLKDNRDWLFWQYANRGRLKGISTYVDLNVFNGTRDEFEKLMK